MTEQWFIDRCRRCTAICGQLLYVSVNKASQTVSVSALIGNGGAYQGVRGGGRANTGSSMSEASLQ